MWTGVMTHIGQVRKLRFYPVLSGDTRNHLRAGPRQRSNEAFVSPSKRPRWDWRVASCLEEIQVKGPGADVRSRHQEDEADVRKESWGARRVAGG